MKNLICLFIILTFSGCATAPTVNPQDVTRISRNVTSLVLRFCYDDADRKTASDSLYAIMIGVRSMTGVAKPTSEVIEATIMGFAGDNEKWRVVASFIALFGNNLPAVADGVTLAAQEIR